MKQMQIILGVTTLFRCSTLSMSVIVNQNVLKPQIILIEIYKSKTEGTILDTNMVGNQKVTYRIANLVKIITKACITII